jgi:hypothetical protein
MANETVFKVQHTMRLDGKWAHFVTDLIFVDGIPHAVLEWDGTPDNEVPQVSVPLDPSHLQVFRSGHVTHLYDIPIEDPRQSPEKLQ